MSTNASNMSGRVCVVTGASAGIGKVTALELARMGADVTLLCRDRGRGEAAMADIQRQTGSQRLSLLLADLSSQSDIRRVAQEIRDRHSALHVLVNNAGAIYLKRELTVDGIERTFATNHLAYFLLTVELLDLLKRSGPARVVSVASDAHRASSGVNFDDIQFARGYRGFRVYGHSKLCNILFTLELARRLQGTSVTANAVHPGFVASSFATNNGALGRIAMKLLSPLALTPERGAQTSIYLASSPEVEGVSGKYFAKCRESQPRRPARDAEAARRLWELSEQMTARR